MAAETITALDGTQHWYTYERNLGNVDLSAEQPRNGNGSVKMTTSSGSDKAMLIYGTDSDLGSFSDLLNGNISFDYYRSSNSTVAAHLAPAFEFSVSANDQTYYLKWEAVYNGITNVIEDQWVNTGPITSGNWWIWDPVQGKDLGQYQSLSNWQSELFAEGGTLTSFNISLGSGWNGTYLGYVDTVNVQFANLNTEFNFETLNVSVVPAPGAILLAGIGTSVVGWLRRRRAL
jgi:hypothetical protein